MILSPEQRYALQLFQEGENVFLTGPGGTGKTMLIKLFMEDALSRNKKIQICAMTGCASLLLNCKARTIHSWSGLQLAKGPNDKIIFRMLNNKKAVQSWKSIDILVIDEVSMMSCKIFEILDLAARKIRNQFSKPFGGVQIIFSGDFYQLPPVGDISEVDTQQFCFESKRWSEVFSLDNHVELTTMFRQTDPIYQDILLNIRNGNIDQEQINILETYIDRVYDPEKNHGCVPTKIYPTLAKVNYVNKMMFDKLPGIHTEYECIRKTNCTEYLDNCTKRFTKEDMDKSAHMTERDKNSELEKLIANSPLQQILSLKIGASVMCIVNLDLENGICNGSIGVVEEFSQKEIPLPVVRFSNGIKREIAIHYWQSDEYPAIAVGQFPLRLAWAITIHKIQGATLPMAEIDIGTSIFEYGQTYVALSRIQSLDGLYLTGFSVKNIHVHKKVKEFYSKIPKVEYEFE
jgi:ATP-dependent DNA helicase PIF1